MSGIWTIHPSTTTHNIISEHLHLIFWTLSVLISTFLWPQLILDLKWSQNWKHYLKQSYVKMANYCIDNGLVVCLHSLNWFQYKTHLMNAQLLTELGWCFVASQKEKFMQLEFPLSGHLCLVSFNAMKWSNEWAVCMSNVYLWV